MTAAVEAAVETGPVSEQELPVIFNEYCTTWGCPSHENICAIVDAIKDKGFSYFVIDAGWYKQEGVPWDLAMGDYRTSPELFPEGMQKTADVIKAGGMKPGIWFEIDTVGQKADSYQQTDDLLRRDGAVLTTTQRRFCCQHIFRQNLKSLSAYSIFGCYSIHILLIVWREWTG